MKPMPYRQLKKLLTKHGVKHVRTPRRPRNLDDWHLHHVGPGDSEIAPGTLRNIEKHLAPCLGEGWLSK